MRPQFTSDARRTAALGNLADQIAGIVPPEFNVKDFFDIKWSNDDCERGREWGATSCPHITNIWPYTPNDAFMAQVCQGTIDPEQLNLEYQAAMRKFLDQKAWVSDAAE